MAIIHTQEDVSYQYSFELELKELESFLSQKKDKPFTFTQTQLFSMRMLTTISSYILNEFNIPAKSDGTDAQYGKLKYELYYLDDYKKAKNLLDNVKDNLIPILNDCSAFHFNDLDKFNDYFAALFRTFQLEKELQANENKSKKNKI